MTVWARIQAGLVQELTSTDPDGRFHPDLVWAACPDGAAVGVGWSCGGTPPIFAAPAAPAAPSLAQQAMALLAGGLAITFTAEAAASGTYAASAAAQSNYAAIQTRLNAGRGFPPGGATTIEWLDTAGQPHVLTATLFTELATAVSDFVFSLDLVLQGATTALPLPTVTIP